MKKIPKVYVVGHDWCNITSFLLFEFTRTQDIKEADIVMFTGGEDINPSLYGDIKHPTTHFTDRDDYEVAAFKAAPKDALLIGGCRGAQLLTALSGGKLFQHVLNHGGGTGGHDITSSDGHVMRITSCHHQMMNPYNLPEEDYELLAWSSKSSVLYTLLVLEKLRFPAILWSRRLSIILRHALYVFKVTQNGCLKINL